MNVVCVCVCVCILRYLVLCIPNLASIRETKPPEGHIADRVWLNRRGSGTRVYKGHCNRGHADKKLNRE